jgi:hypothetical protein
MNVLWHASCRWREELVETWNRFWFTPADPASLCLIRIFTGLMLFYTHLVWSLDLEAFLGSEGWLSADLLRQAWQEQQLAGQRVYFWSHLLWTRSPVMLWTFHIAGLVVFAMLAVGLFSRVTSVLAFLITVSYMHRAAGALFGLDQINVMLAMYLMIGPCGAYYSLDSWWRKRRNGTQLNIVPESIAGNIAIRLIQIHMCVIYFFAGTRKLMGVSWWDGSAMWLSAANQEYQSIDITWLAGWPMLAALLTHFTVLFEIFYCVLIWNRLTRPLILLSAVAVHVGIATCMGMATFGLAMLIGNLAFISSALTRGILERPLAARVAKGRG